MGKVEWDEEGRYVRQLSEEGTIALGEEVRTEGVEEEGMEGRVGVTHVYGFGCDRLSTILI